MSEKLLALRGMGIWEPIWNGPIFYLCQSCYENRWVKSIFFECGHVDEDLDNNIKCYDCHTDFEAQKREFLEGWDRIQQEQTEERQQMLNQIETIIIEHGGWVRCNPALKKIVELLESEYGL